MIRLAVTAPRHQCEAVLEELVRLVPAGVEEVAHTDTVEYAVYGAEGELPQLDPGPATVAGVTVSVSASEVPDDWAERWMRFHFAVLVGGRLYLRPSWEQPAVRPGVIEVVIDPGEAFGTGSHPTTRLCCELLLEIAPEGSLADLGCGTGVLAICAAKLGFGPVSAVDADAAAVRCCAQNARKNGVDLAHIGRFDLRNQPPPQAETVVANLQRALLLRMAERMTSTPRQLIVSGLLESETDEIERAFSALQVKRRLRLDGWAALQLESA